jgi:hypothetical protein
MNLFLKNRLHTDFLSNTVKTNKPNKEKNEKKKKKKPCPEQSSNVEEISRAATVGKTCV